MDRRKRRNAKETEKTKVSEDKDTCASSKRFYGCEFCKQGFDNAQALGGHMNIHREKRKKGKQPTSMENLLRFQPQGTIDDGMYQGYEYDFEVEDPSKFFFQWPGSVCGSDSTWESYSHSQTARVHVDGKSVFQEDEVDLELRL